MDNKPLTPPGYDPISFPVTGGGGTMAGPGSGPGPLQMILLVVFGLGTLIFGVLTVTFAAQASSANKNLESKIDTAAKAASEKQKTADDETYTKASNSPFRAYTAPVQFGSFIINFPKTWSSQVIQERSGTQVALTLNPDFINRVNGTDDKMATRVTLYERSDDEYLRSYEGRVKDGTIKRKDTKVSDQAAVDLTGKFDDQKTVRQVVVPIRDKVLVFATENSKYMSDFDQILAQAKIIP